MKKYLLITLLIHAPFQLAVELPVWIGYDKAYHPRTENIQGPITKEYITNKLPQNCQITLCSVDATDKQTLQSMRADITIVNDENIQNSYLLWLDADGYELQTLKKLQSSLANLKYIYIKVYLIENREECALYQTIRKFLEFQGFRAKREDLPWNNCGYVLFKQKNLPTPYASQPAVRQDRILNEKIFHDMKHGFFIDIGAYDGVSHSNTYFFEKHLDWDGICFEPLPNAYRQLKNTRSCTCINACVSKETNDVEFIEVSGGPEMLSGIVSTYDPRHLQRLQREIERDGGHYAITKVPSINLNEILDEKNIKNVDFISIDTEGCELEILKSIDFTTLNVHVICVENNYKDPKIKQYMESQGFSFINILSGQDEVYINHQFHTKKEPHEN